jgi:microsomal dipeptidase-like Zn-dependent dipeptidase
VDHLAHAVQVAGPQSVAIGLDFTNARSTLKGADAGSYPQIVDALKKRNLGTPGILGENWLRVWDAVQAK